MPIPKTGKRLSLTILVTVVSGKDSVRRILNYLSPQMNWSDAEIIIPFDKWSPAVGELKAEFPDVRFHFIEDLGLAASPDISSHEHRLYDRRRAVGLQLSRGRIIAMTEDHARPAENWVSQILTLHEKPFVVIGGAIENDVDVPLNWALYYCDFGRYGRPFATTDVEYVSDVNVTYKRDALMAVSGVWQNAYHETSVHWAMKSLGMKFILDENLVVYQQRPKLPFAQIFRERISWGRIFAETRVSKSSFWQRVLDVVKTPLLPAVLLVRIIKNMRRQKRTFGQMKKILPISFILLLGWSLGEFIGYVSGEPELKMKDVQPDARIDNPHPERVT